jgi:hypothetical protein
LLANGSVSLVGPTDEVCRTYVGSLARDASAPIAAEGPLNECIGIEQVLIRDSRGNISSSVGRDECFTVEVTLNSSKSLPEFQCFMGVSQNETRIFTMRHSPTRAEFPKGCRDFSFFVPSRFMRPGLYQIGIGGVGRGLQEWIWASNSVTLEISGHWDSDDDRCEIGAIDMPRGL